MTDFTPIMKDGWQYLGIECSTHLGFNSCYAEFLNPKHDKVISRVWLDFRATTPEPEYIQKAYDAMVA